MVAMLALVCPLMMPCGTVKAMLPTPAACETRIKSYGWGASGSCQWATGWSQVSRRRDALAWHIVRSDGTGNADDGE